jgi:hypothetical protein
MFHTPSRREQMLVQCQSPHHEELMRRRRTHEAAHDDARAHSRSPLCAHCTVPPNSSSSSRQCTHCTHSHDQQAYIVTYRAICDVAVLVHETKTIVVFVAMVVGRRRRAQFEHRLVDATIARASVAWLPSWHRLVDRRDCGAESRSSIQQQQRDRRKQQRPRTGTSRTPKQSIVPS